MWGLPKKDFQILLEREAKEENKASVHQPGNPMMSLMIPDSLAAELSSHTHLKKKERERKKKIIRRHLPRPSQTSSGTRWVPTMHASYLLRYAEFITHWMTSTTKSAVFGFDKQGAPLKNWFSICYGETQKGAWKQCSEQLEVLTYAWQPQWKQKWVLSTWFTHGHHRRNGHLAWTHLTLQQWKCLKARKTSQVQEFGLKNVGFGPTLCS